MSDIRVCRKDGEPLVFTFEFPGAEYICMVCGGLEDIFGQRVPATPELQHRLDELTEQFALEQAERRGIEPPKAPPRVGDAGVVAPTCKTCEATPEAGVTLEGGKPRSWFSRTIDGVTEYACSRSCIPSREAVLPW